MLAVCMLAVGAASRAQQLIPLPFVKEEWKTDYEPFRIVGNLYYVGTYDLAVYLITTPRGHILINTGLAGSAAMIRRHVEALGFKYADIKILLASHVHYDHVGDMAAIQKETGATVMVNEKDAPVLADGANSDYLYGGKGMLFAPVQAGRLLHEHDTVSLGGMHIVALHHPGHTPGATSFLLDVQDGKHTYRVLIANMPSVIVEGSLKDVPAYPGIIADYAYTFKDLKAQRFDIWLAAHASQFNMHKKHKPGDAYNPTAFAGRSGFDESLSDLEKTYLEKKK